MDDLTLRIGLADGSHVDETIDVDFTDLAPGTMYEIISRYPDQANRTAALVRAKLSDPDLVPQKMMVDLLQRLWQGEGVTVG